MTRRRDDIDLIKLIAAILVVTLHAIGTSENGIQQCVYLVGSFGIPLFLTVSGYLMTNKKFTARYLMTKTFHYIRFMLIWGLMVGACFSIIKHDISILPDTILGMFVGKGYLFQLWFVPALLLIYLMCYLMDLFNLNRQQIFGGGHILFSILLIQLAVFVINYALKINYSVEIREIIYPPLRLITNFSFFTLGEWIRLNEDSIYKYKIYFPVVLMISFITTCALSLVLKLPWASSFYDFPILTIGMISLFELLIRNDVTNRYIRFFLDKSIGIWVLHPILLLVLNKVMSTLNIDLLIVRIVCIFICVFISGEITSIVMKNRILKNLFIV